MKIIVEKHSDGYDAYPFGLKGVVMGESNTYEEALADVKSAIVFHIETFGEEALESEAPVLEAFVTEVGVASVRYNDRIHGAMFLIAADSTRHV